MANTVFSDKFTVAISTSIQIIEPSKKISNHLRFREKQKLMDKYQWAKDDPLKEALEKDPNMFLSILYLKEVEQTQTVSDQGIFRSHLFDVKDSR